MENYMKKFGLFVKTILFLAVLSVVMSVVIIVTQRKESYIKTADFFREAKKDHLDVLFLGSSHVINGINPIKLFEDYGISSYNLGGHGSLMQEDYWQLMCALDYCKPKVVVVDCYMLEKDYQFLDVCEDNTSAEDKKVSVEQLHLGMDAYPISMNKIAAIKDLIQDTKVQNEFLCDFSIYHDRWSDLASEDFGRLSGDIDTNRLMGAEMRYGVKTENYRYGKCKEGERLSEPTVGAKYLMKIIEKCRKENIEIVLVYLPFSADIEDQIAANTMEFIADGYDIPAINMLEIEGVIDEEADLNDHGHLNEEGSARVTDVIGEYLSENENLTDHRNDEDYSEWMDLCERFNEEVKDTILAGNDIRTLLSLLRNSNISSILYMNYEVEADYDEGILHLIELLAQTDDVRKAAETREPYILIRDSASGNIYEAYGSEVLDNVSTAMGDLTYIPVERDFRLLYPDGDDSVNYLYDDEHIWDDIQILLYDSDTGEVLRHFYYNASLQEYQVVY